ncbi:hypothetical protein RvY_09747 [Ramazzottius varieornatus]|uniref:Uncharacterized protein n=1 Tax=Ramazzottius varieornatus TaxID=947166 RepID=A0A1D1VFU5_RAMVA|nr:hypothetical protein RvY_09747 [Ramazzottius varieornatus]
MSGDAADVLRHSFKRKRRDSNNYAFDIFRPLAPQFYQRRFGVPEVSDRDKLQAALDRIEKYGYEERHFSSGYEPDIVPPPPQVSRLSVGGLAEFTEKDAYFGSKLARPSKTTMTNLQQSTRKALKLQKPVDPPVAKTRSQVRRERMDLFRQLADKAHAKHHVLYDHHDHREYDRDIRRGIRGRGMVTPSKVGVPQSDHSFASWSSSSTEGEESYTSGDESTDDNIRRDRRFSCYTKTWKLDAPKEKWAEKYLAHHRHHRRDKYRHPKEVLRQTLQHNLNHSVRHAKHTAGRELDKPNDKLEVPNWIVNQIWSARKFWPLYRLRRKTKLLEPVPAHLHNHHLHVHGHTALRRPKTWQPEDYLQHRYDALAQAAPAESILDQVPPGHKVLHRLEEHMPASMLHRHTHSVTNVVAHLLHADKKFEHLYNPSIKPPMVRVGKAMVPLNEDFIRKTSVVMNHPGFKELHKDLDESALVIAKLIQDAAKNGLVAAMKTIDSAPEVILGPTWNKISPEVSNEARQPDSKDVPLGSVLAERLGTQEVGNTPKIALLTQQGENANTSVPGGQDGSFPEPLVSLVHEKDQNRENVSEKGNGLPPKTDTKGENAGTVDGTSSNVVFTDDTFGLSNVPNAGKVFRGSQKSVLGSKEHEVSLNQETTMAQGRIFSQSARISQDAARDSAFDENITTDSKVPEKAGKVGELEVLQIHLSSHARRDTGVANEDPADEQASERMNNAAAADSDYDLGFMQDRPMKYEEPVTVRVKYTRTDDDEDTVRIRDHAIFKMKHPSAFAPTSAEPSRPSKSSSIKDKQRKSRSRSKKPAMRRHSSEPPVTEPDTIPSRGFSADPDFRTTFLAVKAELKTRQRQQMISAISALVKTNNSFSEIVRQRILLQQRKQHQLEAQTRKLQYQGLSLIADASKNKKAKKNKNKGKHRKKAKKPKQGAFPVQIVSRTQAANLHSPPSLVAQKSKFISRRKSSMFQDVALRRRQGRIAFFVPRTVVERTQSLERRYEKLRRRFEGARDRGLSECAVRSRSFGSAEVSELSSANLESRRADLKNYFEEPPSSTTLSDTWKCIRTWLKFFPSDAEAYMKRASFEKMYSVTLHLRFIKATLLYECTLSYARREPEQAALDTAVSLGIEDRLNRAEVGAAYLRRALCYFRIGQD